MNAPWFDANLWAWLPATIFGCLGGAWGTGAGILASKGKGRSLVLGSCFALIAVAAVFLVAGIVALATGQTWGIWFGFLLPGIQGLILFPIFVPIIRTRYREAEERRMHAADFK